MRTSLIILSIVVVVIVSGCAMYGSEAQYNDQKNDWYGLAGSREVARIKQDKLAFEKLQNQPVQAASVNGVIEGFKGLVANLSENRRYNFVINGPEKRSVYLGPGERMVEYLVPGQYVCTIYHGGNPVDKPWSFKVGAQQHVFMNERYHWYLFAER